MNFQFPISNKRGVFCVEKHPTSNIQHRTPNQPETLGSFDVECSMLNVECWFDSLPRQREVQP
jgi:hypothetical protein